MKKTVLITSNAYFPNVGGVENSLRYLASSYKNLGFNVVVVVSDVSNDSIALPAFEQIDGINIYRYSTFIQTTGIGKYFRAFRSARAAWRLFRSLKRDHDITLTLSRFHTTTLLAVLAKLPDVIYLVPGIAKHQNAGVNLVNVSGLAKIKQTLSRHLHHFIQLKALKYCDQVLVFSHNMEKQITELLPKLAPLPIVKPGVDVERFSPVTKKADLRTSFNIPSEKIVLLTVGRFVLAKGFDLVIDAMKDLRHCHLVMVGDGESMAVHQQQILNNHLCKNITLVGAVSNTAPYYQLADIFVMSSRYEPLGQTILEALSTALPIIAFDGSDVVTATKEMLNDDEAVYTSDISANGIVECVNRLTQNPVQMEQLAKHSRNIATSRFSWDTLAQQTLDYRNNESSYS